MELKPKHCFEGTAIAFLSLGGFIKAAEEQKIFRRTKISLGTILLIILVLILIGALLTWGYSGDWEYEPSELISVIFIVLLILFLMGCL